MDIAEIAAFAGTMKDGTTQFFRRMDVLPASKNRGLTVEKNERGNILVRPNKSERNYYQYGFSGLNGRYELVDFAPEWTRKWRRVARDCHKWGLWPSYVDQVERGLAVGYEKVRAAHDAYWSKCRNGTRDQIIDAINAIDPRLIRNGLPDTEVIWFMYKEPVVERMDVGIHTDKLANAIIRKRKGYCTPRVLVEDREHSAQLDENDMTQAWYQREYVGCQYNGSYYLIISPTHAVFLEDD